ncbi:MAG: ArsR/SmtB family transcription factor [Methyloligellaceae bacterium]
MPERLSTAQVLGGLKAAGESTRLRLLALLQSGELNVTDLTRILGQSQPRISRHLKLLAEAGLIERFREGSWVFFRLAEGAGPAQVSRAIVDVLDPNDPVLERDRARADAVKRERAEAAQAYFRDHASEWDRIRTLHIADDQVEAAMRSALGPGPFGVLVDLGTGTGRMLELLADRFERGVGLDISHDMLAYARAKLERVGLANCHVRQGDLFNVALDDRSADAVILHQVLHFLDDPARAVAEAARILAPGGQLLVADFAPHELEFLRDEFAHQRLGFEADQMAQWINEAGLDLALHQDLEPSPGAAGDKLTVSLWLAGRPEAAAARGGPAGEDELEYAD